MIWTWDPVAIDCLGAPESSVTYHVRAATVQIVGTAVDGGPLYAVTAWQTMDLTASTGTAQDAPTPAVGEVALIDVEAIDAAGNVSDGCVSG